MYKGDAIGFCIQSLQCTSDGNGIMKITIEFYGALEPLCGAEHRVEFSDDAVSVAAVLDELATRVPGVEPHLPRTACAVGDELVGREHSLNDGDTLVLLPPVSGG